jgi:DNA-binding response OmpR family regulator
MKIAISKEALLRQLDAQEGDTKRLNSILYLEGEEILDDDVIDPIRKECADALAVLSLREWRIFRELYRNRGRAVSVHALASMNRHRVEHAGYVKMSNNIAVHIGHIRKKLAIHELPYEVRYSSQKTWNSEGASYMLA